jgi:hypothetical protein
MNPARLPITESGEASGKEFPSGTNLNPTDLFMWFFLFGFTIFQYLLVIKFSILPDMPSFSIGVSCVM